MKALRILVVDDDAMLGMMLIEMLEDLGHEGLPLECTHRDAVAAAARHRPDLMLVDVGLGVDSGLAVMDEILPSRFIAHVFMSGNIDHLAALRPGAPVLRKPFDETQLEQAIRGALAQAAPDNRGPIGSAAA